MEFQPARVQMQCTAAEDLGWHFAIENEVFRSRQQCVVIHSIILNVGVCTSAILLHRPLQQRSEILATNRNLGLNQKLEPVVLAHLCVYRIELDLKKKDETSSAPFDPRKQDSGRYTCVSCIGFTMSTFMLDMNYLHEGWKGTKNGSFWLRKEGVRVRVTVRLGLGLGLGLG
jgi:hypothetical protein